MQVCKPHFRPLGAFALSVSLGILYYACLALWTLQYPHGPQHPSGFPVLVWMPVLLCGLAYSVSVNDPSPLALRLFRTLMASTLAPSLAFAFILFVGFVILDWRM